MPYIVTTKSEAQRYRDEGYRVIVASATPEVPVSRRAVATLDEARLWTFDARIAAHDAGGDGRWLIDEQGGTVGPLPDGTVIEVERVELDRLAELTAGLPSARMQSGQYKAPSVLIAAYNAAQEGGE